MGREGWEGEGRNRKGEGGAEGGEKIWKGKGRGLDLDICPVAPSS